MTLRLRSFVLVLSVVVFAILVVVFRPYAEETQDDAPPSVSESDLQTYIQVYDAMQDDHDLTIEEAIKPYHLSLETFRQTERHIQEETRLVERVREALLDHAKKRSLFAQAPGTGTPPPSPTATPARRATAKKSHDKKK